MDSDHPAPCWEGRRCEELPVTPDYSPHLTGRAFFISSDFLMRLRPCQDIVMSEDD